MKRLTKEEEIEFWERLLKPFCFGRWDCLVGSNREKGGIKAWGACKYRKECMEYVHSLSGEERSKPHLPW